MAMNPEVNGLRSLVESIDTLHSIKAPPVRENYASEAEYRSAYDAWYIEVHCWRTS